MSNQLSARRWWSLVLSLLLVVGAARAFADTAKASPKQEALPASVVQPDPMLHSVTETAPVMLDGKELFKVRGVLSFSPDVRAAAITERLTRVVHDVRFDPKKLEVHDYTNTTDVAAGRLVLTSITNFDAALAGTDRRTLAASEAAKMSAAIAAMRGAYSTRTLLIGGAYALIATLGLVLLLRLMSWLFPRLYRRLESWRGRLIPALRIQQFELLPADRIANALIALSRFLRVALTMLLLYFWASLCLRFFPWTSGYSHVLVAYVTEPVHAAWLAFLAYLPRLFTIAFIIFVAVYVMKFTRVIFTELGKGSIEISGFHPEWAEPTYKLVRVLLLVLTLVVVFPYLPGAKTPAFQGISIFLGVLISLGSSSAVANVVAGVILTYMRAFRMGDRVQIADTVGDVIESSLLVTRIRTIKNVEITIANSQVLGAHIVNYSAPVTKGEGLILHTQVTLGYDNSWPKIHELLTTAALMTENILHEPKPFILQTMLDDFYVHYELNAYTDQPQKMAMTYSVLHRNIHDTFDKAGVEIMSPHVTALRRSEMTVPPERVEKSS
ncbi:MAG: mechanosensitive ion channel [Acidobacteriaceae bacterium]|nr:mechanosensitive ion channel [Acidobacteriaceae bacterium]